MKKIIPILILVFYLIGVVLGQCPEVLEDCSRGEFKTISDEVFSESLINNPEILKDGKVRDEFEKRLYSDNKWIDILNKNEDLKKSWFEFYGVVDKGATIKQIYQNIITLNGKYGVTFSLNEIRNAQILEDGRILLEDGAEVLLSTIKVNPDRSYEIEGGIVDLSNSKKISVQITEGLLRNRDKLYQTASEKPIRANVEGNSIKINGDEVVVSDEKSGNIEAVFTGKITEHMDGHKTFGKDTSYLRYQDGKKSFEIDVKEETKYFTASGLCSEKESCIVDLGEELKVRASNDNEIEIKLHQDIEVTIDRFYDNSKVTLIDNDLEVIFTEKEIYSRGNLGELYHYERQINEHVQKYKNGVLTQCSRCRIALRLRQSVRSELNEYLNAKGIQLKDSERIVEAYNIGSFLEGMSADINRAKSPVVYKTSDGRTIIVDPETKNIAVKNSDSSKWQKVENFNGAPSFSLLDLNPEEKFSENNMDFDGVKKAIGIDEIYQKTKTYPFVAVPELPRSDWESMVLERSLQEDSFMIAKEGEDLAVFRFKDMNEQNFGINRISIFVEGNSETLEKLHANKDRIVSMDVYKDHVSDYPFYGHDITTENMARFYTLAGEDLFPQERALRDRLVKEGFISRVVNDEGTVSYSHNGQEKAVLTFPQQGRIKGGPQLSEGNQRALNYQVMRHEYNHGLYFTNSEFRSEVNDYWENDMNEHERKTFIDIINHKNSYNINDRDLMIREFAAYAAGSAEMEMKAPSEEKPPADNEKKSLDDSSFSDFKIEGFDFGGLLNNPIDDMIRRWRKDMRQIERQFGINIILSVIEYYQK